MKSNKKNKQRSSDSFVKVDIFYIPEEQAAMYMALRSAVMEEVRKWFEENFQQVSLASDEELGEYICGLDLEKDMTYRYYLSPSNLSKAQAARDKDQLDTYLRQVIL